MEAIIDAPGFPLVHAVSVYGFASEGLSPNNVELLRLAGSRCSMRHGSHLVVVSARHLQWT